MKVGVPKETAEGERRVALVPDVVRRLAAKDVEVLVEPGAGEQALIPDALFEEAGATVTPDVWGADVVVKVAPRRRRRSASSATARCSSASSRRAPRRRRSRRSSRPA